jgi:hypothetical protein
VGEDTNQIEQDIRETRSDLGRNLDELSDRARQLVSWRSQYRDHSRVFLGAAFSAGLVVGLAAIRRSQQNGYHVSDDASDTDMLGGDTYAMRFSGNGAGANNRVNGHGEQDGRDGTLSRARHELGETWNTIADGLMRTVSAKAVQYLSDLVPGFSEHVEGRYAPRSKQYEG